MFYLRLLICCTVLGDVSGFMHGFSPASHLARSMRRSPFAVKSVIAPVKVAPRRHSSDGPLISLKAAKQSESSKSTKAKKSKPKAVEKTDLKVETLKKGDLVKYVAKQTGLTQKATEDVLAALLQGIQDAVKDGKRVSIPSFGVFSAKARSARKGRNPQTGEEIQIPESVSPGFSPSKAWKDILNNR